jgi:hypothetical protein
MIKDGIFTASDTTISNIINISKLQSALEERQFCEAWELACEATDFFSEMLKEGYNVYEICSMIEGLDLSLRSPHKECLEENVHRLIRHLGTVSVATKAVFSELLIKRLKDMNISIAERDFLQTDTPEETVTYVKNPLSDEAYDVFSEEFKSPKLRYSKSFSEIAMSLRSGEVKYAILPIEEKGGSRLHSVSEMLFLEDLKINSIISVFGYEGNADMKYALVSKFFTIPVLPSDDDRYLEIRLPKNSDTLSLSEFLIAAELLSLNVYKCNTVTFRTEEGPREYFSLILKNEGRDFVSLLLFLTLFSGAYSSVGIYKNLE